MSSSQHKGINCACAAQGCDGSILLNSTANNTAEKDSPLNKGLRGYHVVDSIKAKLETACPGVVSCSDVLALAARDSVRIVRLGYSYFTFTCHSSAPILHRVSGPVYI